MLLGNSIYECSATGPAGFSDPAHPACEVLRRAAVIRTDPTLATERCCKFTGSGIGTARAGETHLRRRRSDRGRAVDSARRLPGKGLCELPSGSFRGRTNGNAKMQNAPPAMRQYQEHVQDLEADGWHRKEVDGDHGLHVVVKKGSPGL